MPTPKRKDKTAEPQPVQEKKYPTEKLLKSRHLSGYQEDFARVILTELAYTISEAKGTLDRALLK